MIDNNDLTTIQYFGKECHFNVSLYSRVKISHKNPAKGSWVD